MQKIFLTFFYSGLSPFAPGTVGTLAGAIVGVLLLSILPQSTLFLLSILITVIAIKEIDKYEKITKTHDSKEIVIDEVAGIWIALSLSGGTILQIVLSIIFFRIFDILKPSYIGKIDRDVKGGLGVMGDDLLAGVIAGICSAGVFQLIGYFIAI